MSSPASLPTFKKFSAKEVDGKFFFGNVDEARYVLNEFRSIVQNKKDSIYYRRIHRFCRDKILNNDHSKDLSIIVNHKDHGDITSNFLSFLDQRAKAIGIIIKKCEFDYIYNGILQHSDQRFTKRFWSEYSSGELNYIFLKHAIILGNIKDMMYWHYYLFSVLTFPKIGPL